MAAAKMMNKDPFTYHTERDSFVKALQSFHSSRGTTVVRLPTIGGREIDLFLLYSKVTALGGWEKVNELALWEDLLEHFHLSPACPNSSHALKITYIRYLETYERIHFRPPDRPPQYDESEDSSSARKRKAKPADLVPSSYHERLHVLSEASRKRLNLPPLPTVVNVVEKLELSLLSGLPNEIDFAINVALLLSSEGKQTLHVAHCPYLVELLLAHVAIFKQGGSLKDLHQEEWMPMSKKNFPRFWYESVSHSDTCIKNLILSDSLITEKGVIVGKEYIPALSEEEEAKYEYAQLFNVDRELGIHDLEGQRALQVATILRNLSFEIDNMEHLALSLPVFRFLMLCVHNKYNSLKQLALDTLGNMALKMTLPDYNNKTTQIMLQTISQCVASQDKFEIVSALDMLAHLCQVEANEDVICDHLDASVYENIVAYITLQDIQLIVHTLEALYQLSELGETPANQIAAIHSAVDVLVNLVSVEAQSFGPESMMGIKVVELMPATGAVTTIQPETNPTPVPVPQPAAATQQKAATPQKTHTPQKSATPVARSTPISSKSGTAHMNKSKSSSLASDSADALATNWLKAFYETCSDVKITKVELFRDYVVTCSKLNISNVVNIAKFQSLVRSTFSTIGQNYVEKQGGGKELLYSGIKRRLQPLPYPLPFDTKTSKAVPGMAPKNLAKQLPNPSPSPAASSLAADSSPNQFPTIQQALMSKSSAVVPPPPCSAPAASVPTSNLVTSVSCTGATTQSSNSSNSQFAPTVLTSQSQHWQPQQPPPVVVQPQAMTQFSSAAAATAPSAQNDKKPASKSKAKGSPPRAASPKSSRAKSPKPTQPKSPKPTQPKSPRPSQPKSQKPKRPASPKAKPATEKSPKAKKTKPKVRKATEELNQGDLLQQAMMESNLGLFGAEGAPSEDSTSAETLLMCDPTLSSITAAGAVPMGGGSSSPLVNGEGDEVVPPAAGGGQAKELKVPPVSLPQDLLPSADVEPILNGLSLPSTPCSVASSIDSKDSEGSQPKDILKVAMTKALGCKVQKEEAACQDLKSSFNGVVKHIGNGDCDKAKALEAAAEDKAAAAAAAAAAALKALSAAAGNGDSHVENGVPSPSVDDVMEHMTKDNKIVPPTPLQVDGCGDDDDDEPLQQEEADEDEAATAALNISGFSEEESAVSAILPSGAGDAYSAEGEGVQQSVNELSVDADMVAGDLLVNEGAQDELPVAQEEAMEVVEEQVGAAALPVEEDTLLAAGVPVMEAATVQQPNLAEEAATPVPPQVVAGQQPIVQYTMGHQPIQVQVPVNSSNIQMSVPPQQTILPQPQAVHQQVQMMQVPQQGNAQPVMQMVTLPVSSNSQLPATSQQQYVQYFTQPPAQYGQPQVAMVSGSQVAIQPAPLVNQPPGQVLIRPAPSGVAASSASSAAIPQAQQQMQVRFVTVQPNGQQQIMHFQVPQSMQIQQYMQPANGQPQQVQIPMVQNATSGQQVTYTMAPQATAAEAPVVPSSEPQAIVPQLASATSSAAKRTRSASPASSKKSSKKKKPDSDTQATAAAPQTAVPTVFVYMCEWKECKRCFASWKGINSHVIKEHFRPQPDQCVCQWDGCDGLRRQKWSLMTHLQDRHLHEQSLKNAAIRRQQQLSSHASSNAATGAPPAPPVYPPDAAIQAIRRFNPKAPYPEFTDGNEGPVTKHIRLTAALILRNLASYSALGRSKLKRHEHTLAYSAISGFEASSALNHCLWELHKPPSPAAGS